MAAFLFTINWIILLVAVTAWPEIPSKGKHAKGQEAQKIDEDDLDLPGFPEPINNVTVSVGRDALMACVVDNLKGYKVAWVRVDTQTILSIHHNVISQNNRISLSYNDHRSWYLHIREVEESDRGWYMCQVNTDPMRSQKGYLQVVVPPVIIESMTSNDLVVREGLNVTLVCKARGYPDPYVMWRREDGEEMLIGGEHVNVVDGEMLHITKVSRLHMAAYLCVASNGVPPSISKRVHLRVQFPPMLSIPNQLEGAYVGQDVVLECHTEAYPASINYWTTERGDMIISDTSRAGDKYETTSTVSGYTKYMKLKIRSVGPNDFGTYRCVAKNSLGETDGNIKLDEMPTPTTAIITDMSGWNRSLVGKHRHRNKFDLNALPDYGVEEWRDGVGNGVPLDTENDNNHTPMRNPPGAFHNSANSANSLQQHNLLGGIIRWIKMQSFGIYKHLTNEYQWQRQQRKQRKQNEKRCEGEQSVPQQQKREEDMKKQQKQSISHAQQQNKWLPLRRQRKNHVSTLQRFTTAYEQSTMRMRRGREKTAVQVYAVTYIRRYFQLLLHWPIRIRIETMKTATEAFHMKAKFEQALGNEEAADVQTTTPSHMALTLRLVMLTAPFSRAILMGATTVTTKAKMTLQLVLIKLQNVGKMAKNVNTNVTQKMKAGAQRWAADDRVNVEFASVSICVDESSAALHAANSTYVDVNERPSSMKSLNEEPAEIGYDHQSRAKTTVNVSSINCASNKSNLKLECINNTVIQIWHKFQNRIEFLAFPFLLILIEIEMIFQFAICLLLFISYTYLQKQQQQLINSILRMFLSPLVSRHQNNSNINNRSATSKSTTVIATKTKDSSTTFPISCQRLTNAIKIISKATRIIRLLCCRQYLLGCTTTSITTTTTLQLQPQSVTISCRKRATINRSIAATTTAQAQTVTTPTAPLTTPVEATTRISTISMHTTITTAIPPAVITCSAIATLMVTVIVTSLVLCCGSILR